ncbi:hypothetical protein HHI36_001776, partial [Cryptolaemus montrouzieri]
MNQFTSSIIVSTEKYNGKFKISSGKKAVPWWNGSCSKAVRECKTALAEYRRTRSVEDLINFKR